MDNWRIRKIEYQHRPVLVNEVIRSLNVKPGKKYIDATVGDGGHSLAILKKGGRVLGIDIDEEAVVMARERLIQSEISPKNWQIVRGNFVNIDKIARERNFLPVKGVLFDLGTSIRQLKQAKRGFSFNLPGPLDMRMSQELKVTAADLINGLNRGELNDLFKRFAQEKYSLAIAKSIINARSQKPIKTTTDLANLVSRVYGRLGMRRKRIHPATKVFQALRIVVNDEINNLKKALPKAFALLATKGRLAVISFHSLEDRVVKDFFKEQSERGQMGILSTKTIRPALVEIKRNPRSRSARLRVGEKQ